MNNSTNSTEEQIIDYYNNCTVDYKIVWHLDSNMSMHYGYWDNNTKYLRDALKNMNVQLAKFGNIKNNCKILDAGCGVGGSSIFLATNYNAEVIGIALPEKQIEQCIKNAASTAPDSNITFKVQNYCYTDFADESFDVVWALESSCHAIDKAQFLKEVFRVLKPGGKLIMADFFMQESATKWIDKWAHSWAVPFFSSFREFSAFLKNSGYKDIVIENKTANILRSIKRLYYYFFPGIIITKIGELFGLRNKTQTLNTLSCYYQYKSYKKGDWNYYFICASKPR